MEFLLPRPFSRIASGRDFRYENAKRMIRLVAAALAGAVFASACFLVTGHYGHSQPGRFKIETAFGGSTVIVLDTATGALHYSTPTWAGDEQGWVQTNRISLPTPFFTPRPAKELSAAR